MSRLIYVPIADSFFESSIMEEDVTTRFVMLALIRLALRAGANGEVDVDPRVFAASIRIPLAEVERSIKRLMEPDPFSSSPDEDGRRLVPVNPDRPFRNWRLVNWQRYRQIVHRAHDAARKRDEYHAKKDTTETSKNLQKSPGTSASLRKSPGPSENLATKTNTNTKTIGKREGLSSPKVSSKGKEESSSEVRQRTVPPSAALPRAEDLLEVWNKNRGDLLPAKSLPSERLRHAKSRLRETPDLERWARAIRVAARSSFCLGENERGWKGNFDWLLRPGTLAKIEEGQYAEAEQRRPYPSDKEIRDFFRGWSAGLSPAARRERFKEHFGVEMREETAQTPSHATVLAPHGPKDPEDGVD